MRRLRETAVADIDVLDDSPASDLVVFCITLERCPILDSDIDDASLRRRWERETPP